MCNVCSSLHGSSHARAESRQMRQVGCLQLHQIEGRKLYPKEVYSNSTMLQRYGRWALPSTFVALSQHGSKAGSYDR